VCEAEEWWSGGGEAVGEFGEELAEPVGDEDVGEAVECKSKESVEIETKPGA
jgi:hypothetical protein